MEAIKPLPLVRNRQALRYLQIAIAHLTLVSVSFHAANQEEHERATDDALTQACEIMKKVSV